jgi:hypothetical protein
MLSHEFFSKLCLVIPIALLIVFGFVLIIPGNAILLLINSNSNNNNNNNYFGTTSNFAYGQQQPPKNQINSNNIADSINTQNIPAKKVRVGDIDIAYKMLGKGEPFLLISPSSFMDAWDPSILRELSSNHTLIIFDNRGVGNTTTGNKPFSIQQLANDTAGLLDAMKIQKVDVLGYSLGSFVAQQLAVMHPEKVNRLILLAASCGGKEGIPQSPQYVKFFSEMVNKSINNIPITPQDVKMILSIPLGSAWMELHPNFPESVPEAKDLFSGIVPNTIKQQNDISQNWMATTGVAFVMSFQIYPILL